MLVTFAEMQGGAKGTTEAEAQLRALIAQDPDPAGLIFLLVMEKAIGVIGEAMEAGLEPLEYWQRVLLTRADASMRLREMLERGEFPPDILETEERILRERRERDAAAEHDDDGDGGAPGT